MKSASLVAMLVGATSAGDCFHSNHMTYLYDLFDYTEKYDNVKEYFIKKSADCTFLTKYDSKVTWYNPSVKIDYEVYYGEDCRSSDIVQ